MEETIRIQSLRWHPQATEQQLEQWKAELLEKDCGTLLVLPDPADPSQYLGILLEKYYTEPLSSTWSCSSSKTADSPSERWAEIMDAMV